LTRANTSEEGFNGREDTPAPEILTYHTPEGGAYNTGSARPTTAVQLALSPPPGFLRNGIGRTDVFDALIGPSRRVEGITR